MTPWFVRVWRWFDWTVLAALERHAPRLVDETTSPDAGRASCAGVLRTDSREPVHADDVDEDPDGVWWRYA